MSLTWFDCNCSYGRVARPAPRAASAVADLIAELDWCGVGPGDTPGS